MNAGRRTVELHLGGSCGLACAPCDCRALPADPAFVERTLREGGARLTVRGSPAGAILAEALRRARATGFGEVVVRTHAHGWAPGGEAAAGPRPDGLLVPLFSEHAAVHDRIAGSPEALVRTLVGMRAAATAGLSVELEVPLLPVRLQRPEAVVELAHRAVPGLRGVRFFVPPGRLPAAIAPPPISGLAPALAAALRACRSRSIQVALTTRDAVPLCVLRDEPELLDAFRFRPGVPVDAPPDCAPVPACEGCAARQQCPTVPSSYREAHGDAGIAPYRTRPRRLYEQRTSPGREWNDEQRRAAKRSTLLVLRPTVNCNQDCTFCSANESTRNVWPDAERLIRQIVRAGRRGVQHLSFSGGEPTLSRELLRFVRAAHRVGIPHVELVTNGVLLDRPERVKELCDAGLTHAYVSLHAHDEELSRLLTQKVGDHPRTVAAVKHLLDAGLTVVVNHVVNERNWRYLRHFVEFAHAQFGGRAGISFAFVTPQYKGLENISVMPRISEVVPELRRAIRRALELGQPTVIGSRQGIPPCFLGELRPWSDALGLSNEAISEDGPQKQRGQVCDGCRYGNHCAGLWKPYAARYGLDELRAVPGGPFTAAELEEVRLTALPPPFRVPRSFAEAPPLLRVPELEGPLPEAPLPALRLPLFAPKGTRPLRLLLVGTGRRARLLAGAAAQVRGISIDAVASPHALLADRTEFGGCPAYEDAATALTELRPDALILAAATSAHEALVRLAIARRVPALIEKPLVRGLPEARELLRLSAGGPLLVPAHNLLSAPGLATVLAGPAGATSVTRRCPPGSPEAPQSWSRGGMFELLHHLVVVAARGAGPGVAGVLEARLTGDSVPERVRLRLAFPAGTAELSLELAAAVDELVVTKQGAAGELRFRRAGRIVELAGPAGPLPVPEDGAELQRMLASFRDALLGLSPPAATLEEAVDALATTTAAIEALEAAGAPFDRAGAPKHVASRSLRG